MTKISLFATKEIHPHLTNTPGRSGRIKGTKQLDKSFPWRAVAKSVNSVFCYLSVNRSMKQ